MSRLKIHFEFRWHETKGDLAGFREKLAQIRPIVIAYEDTTMKKENRLNRLREINQCIDAARKGDSEARRRLELVYSGAGTFGTEQKDITLLQRRAKMFFLETHGKEHNVDDLTDRVTRLEEEGNRKVFLLMPDEATQISRQILDTGMEMSRIREPNIMENLGTLESDLIELFPGFRNFEEIKVVVLYGLAHRAIYDLAVRAGMDATVWYDPQEETIFFTALRNSVLGDNTAISDEILLTAVMESAIANALLVEISRLDRERPTGLGIRLAKQYMEGKSNDELLRVFEAGRNLPVGHAMSVLAMRDDLRQLWDRATQL